MSGTGQTSKAAPGATVRWGPLRYLYPGWYAVVMGIGGLSLAWGRAAPLMGRPATMVAYALGAVAALVFGVLALLTAWRGLRFPAAWAEDRRHPVRHTFVATLPISMVLLSTVAVADGLHETALAPAVHALWWCGALAQLGVTVWVLSRWWQAPDRGGLVWASVTPVLFIPVVGNVLVPLAGLPLGHAEWAAAQFGVGVLFWPVVTVLLAVRIALQGLWPERLLPANFILIAPPAVVGLASLQFGAPLLVVWALWGMALFSLLWVMSLAPRIARQPFGMAHWGLSFPLTAITALTLRLAPTGWPSVAAVALLAGVSLVIAALTLATLRGLRDGRLLAPEAVAAPSA